MQYRPLDKAKKEIRVLRFLDPSSSNSPGDTIQCLIENVPLETSPHFQLDSGYPQTQSHQIVWDAFTKSVDLRDSTLEQTTLDKATFLGLSEHRNSPSAFRYPWGDFEALSYTWGQGGDSREIRVNGSYRSISKNLEKALRVLRDLQETHSGMCYWVDSLCIDQGNEKERNEEVERMKEIYSRARAVIVWLGEEEDMDRSAVQTMRHLCRNPCSELPENLLLNGYSALCAFMSKPYWNRSWIIQELATNHNSTLILCGNLKLTRRMLRLGFVYCKELLRASELHSYQGESYLDSIAWSTASRVYRLINLTLDSNVGVNLHTLLNLVRRADATDMKDEVYGILGLLDPAISKKIVPDYSLTEQQVYTEAVISILNTTQKLEQILFGGIAAEQGWPSWVPDWRLPFERHHIRYLRHRQASGNSPVKIRFLKEGNIDLLACNGFHVDIVDGVSAQPNLDHKFVQSEHVLTRYHSETSEALRRTLLLDHPGICGKLLLEVPWISSSVFSTGPASSSSSSSWSTLLKSSYFRKFQAFRERNEKFCVGGQSFRGFFPQCGAESLDIIDVLRCIRLAVLSLDQRALITTRSGYLGLAPRTVRPGDVVAILSGCTCPVILRSCSGGLYHVLGECYVHGVMDGEILRRESGENTSEQEFVLC